MLEDKATLPPAPAVPTLPNRGGEEDVMAMLEARVDPIQEERMRQKALQFELVGVIERQDKEKLQHLINEGVNIDAQIMYTKTPLTHAIELGHEDVAIMLLEKGCKPTLTVDHFPYSQPIHLAARDNLLLVTQKLIELDVDPNALDADQMSPLTISSYYNRLEMVDYLIRCSAQINHIDSCLRTPLHRAIEAGALDVVKTLLDHKANINATDMKQWTPLHLAIALDYQEIIKLLLQHKCLLDVVDVNGRTPLSIACNFLSRKNYDIVRETQFTFEARKRDFIQGRYISLLRRSLDNRELLQTVVDLINAGANIDGVNESPITTAAMVDHADTVYMLINVGAWIPQDWSFLSTDTHGNHKMLELTDWIKSHYFTQFTLLWFCKRCIRKSLAVTVDNIEKGIDKFPLPPSLKAFLK